MEEKEVETTCGRSTGQAIQDKGVCYHQLYHQCLHRCSRLEAQLNKFRTLAGKLDQLQLLQEKAVAGVASNSAVLDEQLQRERLHWQNKVRAVEEKLKAKERENSELLRANGQLSADYCQLLARYVVGRAATVQFRTDLRRTEASMAAKMRQLEISSSQTAKSLKYLQHEYEEAAEFSDAERQIMQEANLELEAELSNTREALKVEALKARQSASLQQQVASLTKELSNLSEFTKQYQTQAMQKITVLKKNEERAEGEIVELDELIDRVRMVLHTNLDHVKKCPPLLDMLAELDGEETRK